MQVSLIELQGVTKQFRLMNRAVTVMENFSLVVQSGEFLTVLGPSGCGKTTLLRIIAGLERPDGGIVVFEGTPRKTTAKGIGMMFQSYDCFPWMTVSSNVHMGLAASDAAASEKEILINQALAAVGLTDVAKAYPHQLSGGMRQRVALAMTLVGRPRILLLDEPFGALDSTIRENLQNDLASLFRQGMTATVIMVTHDVVEAVRLATRIIVLSNIPTKVLYETSTRRVEPTAPTDDEVIRRCRTALRYGRNAIN